MPKHASANQLTPASAQGQRTTRRDNGDGGFRYRADKDLWQFEIDLPRGIDGKRRKRVLYGKTKQELKQKIADQKAQGGGTLQPADPTKLREYVVSWLERQTKHLRPKTMEAYRWAWTHADPIIGDTKLEKFDGPTAVRFNDALRASGASSYTLSKVPVVLHTIFEDAIARGVYKQMNPFFIARKNKPKHKADEGRALSVDEFKRFEAATRGDRYEAAWILGLYTGMRIGELFGLQWDDIDFEERTVYTARQVTVVDGKLDVADLKTDVSDDLRLKALEDVVMEAFERRRIAAAKEKPSLWVFSSSTNPKEPMNPDNARRRNFADIVARAKIRISAKGTRPGPFTPHDLRHTANSIGAAANIPEKALSARSGHKNSAVTRRYTHIIAGQARETARKMQDFIHPERAQ